MRPHAVFGLINAMGVIIVDEFYLAAGQAIFGDGSREGFGSGVARFEVDFDSMPVLFYRKSGREFRTVRRPDMPFLCPAEIVDVRGREQTKQPPSPLAEQELEDSEYCQRDQGMDRQKRRQRQELYYRIDTVCDCCQNEVDISRALEISAV
jgi:hypothetical protein